MDCESIGTIVITLEFETSAPIVVKNLGEFDISWTNLWVTCWSRIVNDVALRGHSFQHNPLVVIWNFLPFLVKLQQNVSSLSEVPSYLSFVTSHSKICKTKTNQWVKVHREGAIWIFLITPVVLKPLVQGVRTGLLVVDLNLASINDHCSWRKLISRLTNGRLSVHAIAFIRPRGITLFEQRSSTNGNSVSFLLFTLGILGVVVRVMARFD